MPTGEANAHEEWLDGPKRRTVVAPTREANAREEGPMRGRPMRGHEDRTIEVLLAIKGRTLMRCRPPLSLSTSMCARSAAADPTGTVFVFFFTCVSLSQVSFFFVFLLCTYLHASSHYRVLGINEY